ncbi:hypothetical protein BJ912DRAFT_959989, partial [Pholiota molesta]
MSSFHLRVLIFFSSSLILLRGKISSVLVNAHPIASLPSSFNPDAYPSPGSWLGPYTRYLFHPQSAPSPSPAHITCIFHPPHFCAFDGMPLIRTIAFDIVSSLPIHLLALLLLIFDPTYRHDE